MSTFYSPYVFICLVAAVTASSGRATYNAATSSQPSDTLPFFATSLACRLMYTIVMWFIWATKTTSGQPAANPIGKRLAPYLPCMQAFFAITVGLTAAFWLMNQFLTCDARYSNPVPSYCSDANMEQGRLFRAFVELFFIPMLALHLLADTSIIAVFIGWLLIVIALIVYSTGINNYLFEEATVFFIVFTGIFAFHAYVFNKNFSRLTAENERLAFAQANEMRILLGNVAHDFKTVRMILIIPAF